MIRSQRNNRAYRKMSSRRSKRISEGYRKPNKRIDYCQEYSKILKGLDILNVDGDDMAYDIVKDDKDWWEEFLEANPAVQRKLTLDRDYNRPGDEEYDPEHLLHSPEDIESMKYDIAWEEVNDTIDNVDWVAYKDDAINRIIRKHLNQDRLYSVAIGSQWFYLCKAWGDSRGNKIEWIFDEDLLEEDALETIADEVCDGDKDSATQIIRDCCAEINQYVHDNSFANLDKYVSY